jgi:hypothetical protein
MTLHAPPLLEELCIFACHVCVSIRIRCSSTRTTRDRSHTMNDARGAFLHCPYTEKADLAPQITTIIRDLCGIDL